MARFTLPRDLYHGPHALEALKTLPGKRAMICVGGGSMKRFGFLDRAEAYLKEAGMEVELFEGIEPDPSVETVMKGAAAMEKFQPDWIVAIGGGSPIDAAKAMWIKYEYPDITFEDMCKVFGIPPLRRKAHFCAISSTSGTATEVTAFSIITDYQKGIKYPIADFEITPDVAIVDPDLAETMPKKLVAHTGMDAMTHAIEAYVSSDANPLTDASALKAIEMIYKYLPKAVANGDYMRARDKMAYAQYLAGIAFNNASLGYVHAMAHQLGGYYNLPHGVCNAILLPYVEEFNIIGNMNRFRDIAEAMGIDTAHMTTTEAAAACIDAIRLISRQIGIPNNLRVLGVKPEDFEIMAENAQKDVCCLTNPRKATKEQVIEIYRRAYLGEEKPQVCDDDV